MSYVISWYNSLCYKKLFLYYIISGSTLNGVGMQFIIKILFHLVRNLTNLLSTLFNSRQFSIILYLPQKLLFCQHNIYIELGPSHLSFHPGGPIYNVYLYVNWVAAASLPYWHSLVSSKGLDWVRWRLRQATSISCKPPGAGISNMIWNALSYFLHTTLVVLITWSFSKYSKLLSIHTCEGEIWRVFFELKIWSITLFIVTSCVISWYQTVLYGGISVLHHFWCQI